MIVLGSKHCHINSKLPKAGTRTKMFYTFPNADDILKHCDKRRNNDEQQTTVTPNFDEIK